MATSPSEEQSRNNRDPFGTHHRDVVVTKPWGYEYLAFETAEVALWVLHLEPGGSTSMHCHPGKQTGLVLVAGAAKLEFLADSKAITAPDKQMLRRGLFHKTTATSPGGAVVFEVETPNNKHDLVRLEDRYGRESRGYEGSEMESPRTPECLWLEAPSAGSDFLPYAGAELQLMSGGPEYSLQDVPDERIVIFLRGGLQKSIDGSDVLITAPGDVGRAAVLHQVESAGASLAPESLLLVI